MSESKTGYEWEAELNKIARPLGCRIVYKWWTMHLYKKDPDTGLEYYVDGLESIDDIIDFLKSLEGGGLRNHERSISIHNKRTDRIV